MAVSNAYPKANQYPAIVGVDDKGKKHYVRVDPNGVLATGTYGYRKSDLISKNENSPSPIRKIYVGRNR